MPAGTIGHGAHTARVPSVVAGTTATDGAVADGGHATTAWMTRARTPHRARGYRHGAWSRPSCWPRWS
jgi:hypothetical protein